MTEPSALLLPEEKPRLPCSETPVLRLMEGMAEYMTEGELLSVLLPRREAQSALDTGRRLLAEYGSLQALASAPPLDLARRCGLRSREACSLQAAMALGRRLLATPGPDRPRIVSPEDVANLLRPKLHLLPQEEFHVLLLDTRNGLLRDETVTIGLVDRSQVHAREVYRSAIRENCSRIILCHNHPSGDPTPSPQDIESTRTLTAAGKIVGIDVLDHVVIGERTPQRPRPWVSFRESNLL